MKAHHSKRTVSNVGALLNMAGLGKARELPPPADPPVSTLLTVDIGMIDVCDLNPRQQKNEAFFIKLKDAIRVNGLDNPIPITRRPGGTRYMVAAGGNTRLQVLLELGKEPKGEKFLQAPCIFKPYTSDIDILAAHLRENDLRDNLVYIDHAMAIDTLKRMLDERRKSDHEANGDDPAKDCRLSETEFERILTEEMGHPTSRREIGRMGYAVSALWPVIPKALRNGAGSRLIDSIGRLDTACAKVYQDILDNRPDLESRPEFGPLFADSLQVHDNDSLDLDAVTAELVHRIAQYTGTPQNQVRLALDEQLSRRMPAAETKPKTRLLPPAAPKPKPINATGQGQPSPIISEKPVATQIADSNRAEAETGSATMVTPSAAAEADYSVPHQQGRRDDEGDAHDSPYINAPDFSLVEENATTHGETDSHPETPLETPPASESFFPVDALGQPTSGGQPYPQISLDQPPSDDSHFSETLPEESVSAGSFLPSKPNAIDLSRQLPTDHSSELDAFLGIEPEPLPGDLVSALPEAGKADTNEAVKPFPPNQAHSDLPTFATKPDARAFTTNAFPEHPTDGSINAAQPFDLYIGGAPTADAFPPPPTQPLPIAFERNRTDPGRANALDWLRRQTATNASLLIQESGVAGLRVVPDQRATGGFAVIAQRPAASDKEGTLWRFLDSLSGAPDGPANPECSPALVQQLFLRFDNGNPPSDKLLQRLFQLIESVVAYVRAADPAQTGGNRATLETSAGE